MKAKNSSGGGVDAANIMLAQLNAQKPVKKKTSHEMPSSSPGTYIFLSGIEQKYHLKYQVLPPKKEKKST